MPGDCFIYREAFSILSLEQWMQSTFFSELTGMEAKLNEGRVSWPPLVVLFLQYLLFTSDTPPFGGLKK